MNDQAPVAQPGDIDLSYLDDDFAQAEVKEHDFTPVPDGKYQVNVDKVELTKAQTTGNPMLKWTLRILGPTNRDRFLWKNSVMITDTMEYVKKDLWLCGLPINKLSDLNGRLEDLLDVKLEIQKVSKFRVGLRSLDYPLPKDADEDAVMPNEVSGLEEAEQKYFD